ncbi:MAG: D-tyrosyl-tRNA(Tyr) deacylase [Alphaproteobacteria bacterium]|nr:D-tyrosyl-tRNA(Tyr) deacylase [Alphaproteobacteria bacterium]
MKALIQRVTYAHVKVNNRIVGQINAGLLVFLGVQKGDKTENADFLSKKICNLRIFEDENHKMNKSLLDVKGQMLIVSQFTLCGDTSRGNRPGFENAALPDNANALYQYFTSAVGKLGIKTQNGIFGADMKVELLNDGPVTFMLEK